jgi:hypothetical protein
MARNQQAIIISGVKIEKRIMNKGYGFSHTDTNKQTKQTPWHLVRKRTIPTERPPLVGDILLPTFAVRGMSRGQYGGSLTVVNLSFLDRSRYFSCK